MNQVLRRLARADALAFAFALVLMSCGGSAATSVDLPGVSVDSPAHVSVAPGSGQLTVTWDAVQGATSYDVYASSTPDVTTASTKATTTATTQTLPGSNGAVTYVAVAARKGSAQSALSAVSCGVPSPGGAPAAGFALYDALCGAKLDGTLYGTSAQMSRRVQNGALELSVTGQSLESATRRGVRPSSSVGVVGTGATRVTSWKATVAVPAASTATRSGTATAQAALGLIYQPAANRLSFPAGQSKLVIAQLGLQDTGSGLQFFRSVSVCTDPACASSDAATGIAYADGTFPVGKPASYATPYTFAVSLDEQTQTFTFAVAGGSLAGTTTGTADASALFTAQGVNPVNDFSSALLRARAFDPGAAGGSSGTMLATFDDVSRGLAGASATPYDDFSGAAVDPSKWFTGEGSLALKSGALEAKPSVTATTTAAASSAVTVSLAALPAGTHRVRVDVAIPSSVAGATTGSDNRFVLTRALYNDGTAGVAPAANVPNSAVGDVQAQVSLSTASARYVIFRSPSGPSASTTTLTTPASGILPTSPAHPLGARTVHTLLLAWDPAAHTVTFQLDDATAVTIDPTSATDPHIAVAAPIVDATPHVDGTALLSTALVGSGTTPGASGSATYRLNNILVAP